MCWTGHTRRRRGATSGNIVTSGPYIRAGASFTRIEFSTSCLGRLDPQVLELHRGRDEADVAALLHQPADPPVVVVFLLQHQHTNYSNPTIHHPQKLHSFPHNPAGSFELKVRTSTDTYLNVQEVPDVEGNGVAMYGRVVVQSSVVGHVRSYGECYRFRLENRETVVRKKARLIQRKRLRKKVDLGEGNRGGERGHLEELVLPDDWGYKTSEADAAQEQDITEA